MEISAVVASGCGMIAICLSKRPAWPGPKAFSAAIRSRIACGAVVAVTAMRISGLMSVTGFTEGSFV